MRRRVIGGIVVVASAAGIILPGFSPVVPTMHPKCIALSFDDGPFPDITPKILDILDQYHIKATFFLVGTRVVRDTGDVLREVQAGHVIGNHSRSHPNFLFTPDQEKRRQLTKTQDAIHAITKHRPTLFRPPFGMEGFHTFPMIRKLGMADIKWTIDTDDWSGSSMAEKLAIIKQKARNGSVLLLHDSTTNDIEQLPTIIETLRQRGYKFVTIPELFPKSLQPGRVYTGYAGPEC